MKNVTYQKIVLHTVSKNLSIFAKKSFVIEVKPKEKEKNWKIIQEITMHVE